jgi:hypothetical protein
MIRRLVFLDFVAAVLIAASASALALLGNVVHAQHDWAIGQWYGFVDLTESGLWIRCGRNTPSPAPTPGIIEPTLDIVPATETIRLGGPEKTIVRLPGFVCVRGIVDEGTFQIGGQGPFKCWGDWYRDVRVRWWAIALLAALPPLSRLPSYIRRRMRIPDGFCQHCAYDLRASKDRCPECGTPMSHRTPMPVAGT